MKVRLLINKLLIFSIPFLVFVFLYFYWDPFKVIRHYDSYYLSGQPNYIALNKDFVSTENWINHHERYNYDSYIFGNSRSMFYRIGTWKNYIGADSEKCYHFDASAESIFGIARKLQFLAARNVKVRNALFVIDNGALNKADNSAGHIFEKCPPISGESPIAFHVDFLKDFFDFDFLRALIDFKISGRIKDYMTKDFLLDDRPFYYDYVTNEVKLTSFDDLIQKDPAAYYEARRKIFFDRDTTVQKVYPSVVKAAQLKLLQEIKQALVANQTSYKIVISPLYDQKKLNPADLQILQQLFGSNNVFDFSGINHFTRSRYNYYETSHYRPEIADSIMKIVYGR